MCLKQFTGFPSGKYAGLDLFKAVYLQIQHTLSK